MKKFSKLGTLTIFALILATLAYLYVPTLATQPGVQDDPLVTRRFVEQEIAKLASEVATLRGIISGNPQATPRPSSTIPDSQRDPLFAEIMEYFETVYGERLDKALANVHPPGFLPSDVIPFVTLNPQEGQSIIFEAGAEFILRGGRATAITGVNGIADVTAGADVLNGESIGLNHLMMVPRSDGRGVTFNAESWIMVRGGYAWQ
jgi:hypothetical protein